MTVVDSLAIGGSVVVIVVWPFMGGVVDVMVVWPFIGEAVVVVVD